MKPVLKRSLLIIFGITLATSVVAYGGHHFAHNSEYHAEWVMKKVSHELDLNEDQKLKLYAVKEEILTARKAIHKQYPDTHEEVMGLLDQDTMDRQQALELVTNRTQAITDYAPGVINAIGDFYDSLTPEQRDELRKHIQNRISHHQAHHSEEL